MSSGPFPSFDPLKPCSWSLKEFVNAADSDLLLQRGLIYATQHRQSRKPPFHHEFAELYVEIAKTYWVFRVDRYVLTSSALPPAHFSS